MDGRTYRQIDRQTDRQTDRQADRQADTHHTYMHAYMHILRLRLPCAIMCLALKTFSNNIDGASALLF